MYDTGDLVVAVWVTLLVIAAGYAIGKLIASMVRDSRREREEALMRRTSDRISRDFGWLRRDLDDLRVRVFELEQRVDEASGVKKGK